MNTPHIVVSRDNHPVGKFPINRDSILIGRNPDSDICLNSLSISGHHSKIITVIDSFFLEDLNSTNGTYVNSRSIKKHVLQNGDVIQIGNHQLEFVAPETHAEEVLRQLNQEDILEQTIVLGANDLQDSIHKTLANQKAQELSATEVPLVEPSSEQGKLQVLNGKHAGSIIPLLKSLTTFGSPGSSVAGITKRPSGHFLIRVQGGQESIRLNGEPAAGKAQALEEHDIIEVANTKLEFFIE